MPPVRNIFELGLKPGLSKTCQASLCTDLIVQERTADLLAEQGRVRGEESIFCIIVLCREDVWLCIIVLLLLLLLFCFLFSVLLYYVEKMYGVIG